MNTTNDTGARFTPPDGFEAVGTYGYIACGDILEQIRKIPDETIDLVVTSPPYNIEGGVMPPGSRKGKRGAYDSYKGNLPPHEYVAWQRQCLTEMLRVVKPTGAVFYNHKKRCVDKRWQDLHEITSGFPLRQEIIWVKNNGAYARTPYVYTPTSESVFIFAKDGFVVDKNAASHTNVWRTNFAACNEHPAPFAVEMASNCIASLGTGGGIVLDPFFGSGTTGVAAVMAGKTFVGIEQSRKYCEAAKRRILSHSASNAFSFDAAPQADLFA